MEDNYTDSRGAEVSAENGSFKGQILSHVRGVPGPVFTVRASAWFNQQTGLWQPQFCLHKDADSSDQFPWFLYRGFADVNDALDAAINGGLTIARYWESRFKA